MLSLIRVALVMVSLHSYRMMTESHGHFWTPEGRASCGQELFPGTRVKTARTDFFWVFFSPSLRQA